MSLKVGILLAAGDGVRMGGPKALLLVHGEPLLVLHVRRLLEAGCDEVLVAIRPHVAKVLPPMPANVRMVMSTATEPSGSLASCVAELPAATSVVVVQLVAMLPVLVETHQALEAALTGDILAVTPRFSGKGGHPVYLRPSLIVSETNSDVPLSGLLDSIKERRLRVIVSDDFVTSRLSGPLDSLEWLGKLPEFARFNDVNSERYVSPLTTNSAPQ